MATKTDKKSAIRQEIIDSARVYSQELAGKAFLYVYGDEYIEVAFPTDHFLHLTKTTLFKTITRADTGNSMHIKRYAHDDSYI